jgi:hypothetical protein
MVDNKLKDEKINELEDRIAALEQHSLIIDEPKEVKKSKYYDSNRMSYICGRIEGRHTITPAVYADLVKYTTYTDGDDPKAVEARRGHLLKAFNKLWTALDPTNTEFINDEDSWAAVDKKLNSIIGISDKDLATSKLLED